VVHRRSARGTIRRQPTAGPRMARVNVCLVGCLLGCLLVCLFVCPFVCLFTFWIYEMDSFCFIGLLFFLFIFARLICLVLSCSRARHTRGGEA
jgi:hypothetical protein